MTVVTCFVTVLVWKGIILTIYTGIYDQVCINIQLYYPHILLLSTAYLYRLDGDFGVEAWAQPVCHDHDEVSVWDHLDGVGTLAVRRVTVE